MENGYLCMSFSCTDKKRCIILKESRVGSGLKIEIVK